MIDYLLIVVKYLIHYAFSSLKKPKNAVVLPFVHISFKANISCLYFMYVFVGTNLFDALRENFE